MDERPTHEFPGPAERFAELAQRAGRASNPSSRLFWLELANAFKRLAKHEAKNKPETKPETKPDLGPH